MAVAKILKAIVDEEQPGVVLCGKQAIDNDMNATGQMLSASWLVTSDVRIEVGVEGDGATVTREVTVVCKQKVKMP